jgi:hypothetical protein
MKIASLSASGIDIVIAKTIPATREGGSPFYCVTHGDAGKMRWEIRIPINNQDIPTDTRHPAIELRRDDFDLIVLDRKQDVFDNPGLILRTGKSDHRYLILWNLTPGLNGGAQYKVEGNARVISKGLTSQEEGSKRGQADCPVVLINGPCALTWYREGNVFGQPRAWCATYDGSQWDVLPKQEDWMKVLADLRISEDDDMGENE